MAVHAKIQRKHILQRNCTPIRTSINWHPPPPPPPLLLFFKAKIKLYDWLKDKTSKHNTTVYIDRDGSNARHMSSALLHTEKRLTPPVPIWDHNASNKIISQQWIRKQWLWPNSGCRPSICLGGLRETKIDPSGQSFSQTRIELSGLNGHDWQFHVWSLSSALRIRDWVCLSLGLDTAKKRKILLSLGTEPPHSSVDILTPSHYTI